LLSITIVSETKFQNIYIRTGTAFTILAAKNLTSEASMPSALCSANRYVAYLTLCYLP
jgi:hypothetical protein